MIEVVSLLPKNIYTFSCIITQISDLKFSFHVFVKYIVKFLCSIYIVKITSHIEKVLLHCVDVVFNKIMNT